METLQVGQQLDLGLLGRWNNPKLIPCWVEEVRIWAQGFNVFEQVKLNAMYADRIYSGFFFFFVCVDVLVLDVSFCHVLPWHSHVKFPSRYLYTKTYCNYVTSLCILADKIPL